VILYGEDSAIGIVMLADEDWAICQFAAEWPIVMGVHAECCTRVGVEDVGAIGRAVS
jgi:hypothetical protein